MSLEQALLDRLEKRSLQIAQQKNEIYGLRQLVNEKMAINEQLAEQITTARLEREQMQHQISELRTECDRIREISKSLVPKSALNQAVQEAAELRSEVVKLRAEVPLESTREGLKNAVAKLQEVTTEKDRMRLQLENARADLKQALVERDSFGAMAADHARTIEELKQDVDRERDRANRINEEYEAATKKIMETANKLGRTDYEAVDAFMERQALRLAALESKAGPSIDVQVMAHDLGDELEKAKEEEARLRALLDESCRTRIGLEFERDKMKAKLRPLEEFYAILKQYRDQRAIGLNAILIYDHVITVELALSQLTA